MDMIVWSTSKKIWNLSQFKKKTNRMGPSRLQCDQMARLFFNIWAIYNDLNVAKSNFFHKVGSKYCQKLNEAFKYSHLFCQSDEISPNLVSRAADRFKHRGRPLNYAAFIIRKNFCAWLTEKYFSIFSLSFKAALSSSLLHRLNEIWNSHAASVTRRLNYFSLFGHLEQWNLPNSIRTLPK